jgi:pimeloyl-ACP methyl ester carboxylesterase
MPPPKIDVKMAVLSTPILVLCDVVTATMKAVAPLSAALVVFRIWAFATGRRQSLLLSRTTTFRRAVNIWLLCEALFFLYCQRVNFVAQAQPPETKVVKMTKEERSGLFQRCLQTVNSPQEFAESWYRTDHTFRDLRRDNIREWLGWGLFHKNDVNKDMDADEKVELEEMLLNFERACSAHEHDPDFKIPDGYNKDAKLMKFSAEPVTHTHRPLVMYTAVHFLLQEVIAPLRLSRMGFVRQQHKTLSYQYRPGVFPEKEPLVFIHGLGVGVLPYERFLKRLVRKTEDENSSLYGRSVLCVELHAVSQRLSPPELHRDDFVDDMKEIMETLGFNNGGIIMGHSYGSFATAWLAHRAPELVHALALLDPACLFLHFPNVLYSILYKSPTNAYERFMHFLIREELFFNAHARRHFFWYANVLFLEDVDTAKIPTMVVLSEDDFIVPIRPGLKYVQEYNQGRRLAESKFNNDPKAQVDLVYLEDCDHGGFLWMDHHGKRVADAIERLGVEKKKPLL